MTADDPIAATAAAAVKRRHDDSKIRLGWIPAVYVILAGLYSAATMGMLVAARVVMTALALDPRWMALAPWGAALLAGLMLGFAVATWVKASSIQRGTPGRGRLVVTAAAGVVHLLAWAGALVILFWAIAQPLSASLTGVVDPQELFLGLPPWAETLFRGLFSTAMGSLLVLAAGCVSSWFLVPDRVRRITWIVVDVVLVVAFLLVTATLPLEPRGNDPAALLQPAIRLTVTILFSARALAWLMPYLLDLVERMGFQAMIASRHLRARKSNFLTAIGVLSIMAVTVSSCALTTTLSVMGGFRNDLKQKILGNNAHVVVDKEHGTFGDWEPMLRRVRGTRDVIAATPYVSGEVMVTSASNLAGAVLRGIDPATASQVIDLETNLSRERGGRGRMEYLVSPELLLDLPVEETRGPMPLEVPRFEVRADDPPAERGGSPIRDLDDLLDPTSPTPPAPGEGSARGDIEEFLRGPDRVRAPKEVLPGIIVGRELARSLRLYVGDEVNVVSPLGDLGPAGPMPKSRPFRVAGIFYSGMYEFDMKYAYVTLQTAQRFLKAEDRISGIEVKVRDFERAPAVARLVRDGIGREDVRVRDWQEANRNLFGALQLEKLAMFIFLGIAILVAGFCVFGTLTLMVQEKNREVGVLKALGTRSQTVIGLFLIEGTLIGLFGSGLGLGLGYVVCWVAEHFGIRMNPEVYYIDKLPVHIDPWEFVLVGVASVVVCVLATVFPAVLASKVRPVDALRYE